jgi:4-alpha-glucanotransferase
MSSVARTAIVPMQDVLGLGSEARMNTPGHAGGNWRWRLEPDAMTPQLERRLLECSRTYGRVQTPS